MAVVFALSASISKALSLWGDGKNWSASNIRMKECNPSLCLYVSASPSCYTWRQIACDLWNAHPLICTAGNTSRTACHAPAIISFKLQIFSVSIKIHINRELRYSVTARETYRQTSQTDRQLDGQTEFFLFHVMNFDKETYKTVSNRAKHPCLKPS